LPTVLQEVSRIANVEFVLADDALATIRVGGHFCAGEIDGLLVALRDNFDIE
jgi:transmembrane sensor